MVRSLLAVLAIACIGGASRYGFADTPSEVRVGEVLRDTALTGLNGPSRNLSEFRGKPLVINVWASWCGPCRAEMASLERLAWLETSSYFTVIGVSTDDYSDRANAALAESNATISHFIDHDLVVEKMLGAAQIPLTVLVDADGRVLQKIHGAIIDAAFHVAAKRPR